MSNQPSKPTFQFSNLTEEELRDAFLSASVGPRENGNRFFNRFKYVNDLFTGNYAAALNQGLDLLNKCQAIDKDAFSRIHKGSAYYWIGTAAFMVHEHELATYFFDAAISEDLRGGADPSVNNSSPSFRYILIEGEPPEQAARELVKTIQARVEELINNYNSRLGRSSDIPDLSISDLRERFLRPSITKGR